MTPLNSIKRKRLRDRVQSTSVSFVVEMDINETRAPAAGPLMPSAAFAQAKTAKIEGVSPFGAGVLQGSASLRSRIRDNAGAFPSAS